MEAVRSSSTEQGPQISHDVTISFNYATVVVWSWGIALKHILSEVKATVSENFK
jgi:uncharacterized Rmd1/YagE family protein